MKPIKLTMNAFASFANEVVIDFTQLNQNGFYLITGPTGSGKTTIFDAIMFALYGEASGNIRNQDGFRSDLVDEKTPTYVEFVFEKDKKEYTITRSPRYTVSYRQTPIESKVSLKYDNHVIEKIQPVSEEIERILGLNAEQFRQVIMLAQGEFMKLIHAKSSERDEIFRKIFGTEIFEQVELALKNETKTLKNSCMIVEEKLKNLLHNLKNYDLKNFEASTIDYNHIELLIKEINLLIKTQTAELNKYKDLCTSNNNNLIKLVEEKQIAQNINNYFEQLDNLHVKKQNLISREEEINKVKQQIEFLKKINLIKPLYEQINLLNEQLLQRKVLIQEKQQLFNQQQEELNCFIDQTNMIELDRLSLDNLRKTYDELLLNLNLKEELNNLEDKQIKLSNEYQQINKYVDEITTEHEDLKNLIKNCDDFINKEGGFLFDYHTARTELNDLTSRSHNLIDIINQYDKYLELDKKLKELVEEYEQIYQKYSNKEAIYQENEYAYFKNIAQILSKTLKDNTPCPVCGSLIHPSPCSFEDDLITKEELEKLNNEITLIKSQKDELLIKVETTKKEHEYLKTIICNRLLIKDIKDASKTIKKTKKAFSEETDILVKKISDVERNIQEVRNQRIIKEDIEKKLQEISKKLINNQDRLLNIIKEQSLTDGEIKSVLSKITIENDITEIQNAIEERKEAIELLEEAIKGFDIEYAKVKETYNLLKGELDSLNSQSLDLEKDLSIKQKEYDKLIKEYELTSLIDDLDIYIKELPKLTQYIEDVSKYITETQTVIEQIENLNNILKDKERTDLSILDHQINNLKEEIKTINENIENYQSTLNNLKYTNNQLIENFKIYQKATATLTELLELSKVANGQNPKYLSFERYVLIEYFDNILNYANNRLSKMTNGRYILYRKVDKSKGRSQQGLDMEIFDLESGKRRDVTTLSGGETFKAALSLALGLADAIETKIGGITIDTLFIDEGFGTLDEDSLRQAIDILLDLRVDNKTLAVISHVQELKEMIPTKLEVLKGDVGSKIKIIK